MELDDLFDPATAQWDDRMRQLLESPDVSQIVINRHDRVFYTLNGSTSQLAGVFPNADAYVKWLNQLLTLTDVGYDDVLTARTSVIEGSFNPARTAIHGSIHLATRELTRGEPGLTVRKQPRDEITLDQMLQAGMMDQGMRLFLEQVTRGRANMLISGGSGAGKTTLARALSFFVDPAQRVVTCEEIDELHLYDRLPNVMALTTYKDVEANGAVIRRTELTDLVRETLRMRADRVWVGETRGKEAFALVKACNSGHDGSITTVHADDGATAVKQVITYVMEAGVGEEVARDQIARAFHLVVQIERVQMGRRVISEIAEVESTIEGREVRRNMLWKFNHDTGRFEQTGRPTPQLRFALSRYGVSLDTPMPSRR